MSDIYIHPLSDVSTIQIGSGTHIWQFCVILPGAQIGTNCNICAHVFIESDVIIGNRVTIKSGVQLWDGVRIEDDVFIGPNVTLTNDKYPKSRNIGYRRLGIVIRSGASIGGGATILPGVEIGEGANVGAGAVVTKSVNRGDTVVGCPARPLVSERKNDGQLPPRTIEHERR